jgi:hypothetical protein
MVFNPSDSFILYFFGSFQVFEKKEEKSPKPWSPEADINHIYLGEDKPLDPQVVH